MLMLGECWADLGSDEALFVTNVNVAGVAERVTTLESDLAKAREAACLAEVEVSDSKYALSLAQEKDFLLHKIFNMPNFPKEAMHIVLGVIVREHAMLIVSDNGSPEEALTKEALESLTATFPRHVQEDARKVFEASYNKFEAIVATSLE